MTLKMRSLHVGRDVGLLFSVLLIIFSSNHFHSSDVKVLSFLKICARSYSFEAYYLRDTFVLIFSPINNR